MGKLLVLGRVKVDLPDFQVFLFDLVNWFDLKKRHILGQPWFTARKI